MLELLSDDDRRALEEVLLKLPTLRYPMSEEEQAEFMNAYCELKGHPPWKPILVTSVELTRRKAQQDEEMSKQRHALRKAFKLGQLNAVDRSHIGVVELSIDCYFPREQAIAYLRWNGMEYCDPASDGAPSTTESAPDKANTELNGDPVCIVGILPDGADRRSAIYEFQRDLMKKGVKKFTKLTAEKFDISDSRVRKIVRDMKGFLEANPSSSS